LPVLTFISGKDGFSIHIIDKEGYDPLNKDPHVWLDEVKSEVMDRHRKYDKMYTVYSQETKMSPFEIKSKIPPKDQRIHMALYFIPPDEEIEKFDVY